MGFLSSLSLSSKLLEPREGLMGALIQPVGQNHG